MNLQFLQLIQDVAILFPAFLVVFTFRGFFKSLVTKAQGDPTAQELGFLTLNPLAHIDVFGLLLVLGVSVVLGGLLPGKFSRASLFALLIVLGVWFTYPVPVNEQNFKRKKLSSFLAALAGPLGSLIFAFVIMHVLKYLPPLVSHSHSILPLVHIFSAMVVVSIRFAVMDLIPLPPFIGGYMLSLLLPESKQHLMLWLEEYSLYIIFALFFLPGISDSFLAGLSWVSAKVYICLSLCVI